MASSVSSSYTMQATKTRSRPPPPPLRLHKSPVRASSSFNDKQLLYDLPTSSSITSPPPSQLSFTSPTSATHPAISRPRGRANRSRRPSSPASRSRSATPQPFLPDEVEAFARNCRAWYFEQDESAGRDMTQTLTDSPASERAQYARIQAAIRAAYHSHVSSRRRAEFQAHLSATTPGGSLPAHCRADPSGLAARHERHRRLQEFVASWCNVGMPGTRPFFEGLWAILRLQLVREKLGGAGRRKICWEIDDAVFMESAGKDFMIEAIDVLKGVLGFAEHALTRAPSRVSSSHNTAGEQIQVHIRARSEPLKALSQTSNGAPPSSFSPRKQRPVFGARARAPSDPFLDSNTITTPTTATPTLVGSASIGSSSRTANDSLVFGLADDDFDLRRILEKQQDPGLFGGDGNGENEQLRTWISPDLTNPELNGLVNVFPSFLTRRAMPRFPAAPSAVASPSVKKNRVADVRRTTRDIEEGFFEGDDTSQDVQAGGDDDEEGQQRERQGEIRIGTGAMWLSANRIRNDGWQGTIWERLRAWWRRVFC